MNIIIFTLGEKEYGVDIKQVLQVIRTIEIVPVPDAAVFVEGVINFRGRVIPLVNLRKKFGIAEEGAKRGARIIIARLAGHIIGFLVDSVSDVVRIEPGLISSPDEVLKDAAYLAGVAKINKKLILMVDIEKVLSAQDRGSIGKVKERVEVRKKNA